MSDDITKEHIQTALKRAKQQIELGDLSAAGITCRDIIKLDPNNKVALQVISELTKRQQIMKKGATSGASSKSITCPSCSASLALHSEETEIYACQRCGSVLDLESDELKILSKVNNKEFAPESFIALGKECTYHGKKYQVIGRACYKALLKEWDYEDLTYCNEQWDFDEWILVSENKEYMYLNEDKEGYSISTNFTPTNPCIPKWSDRTMTLKKDTIIQRITEHGIGTIQYFEGEFTWTPSIGDKMRWSEYLEGILHYSVEYRVDKDEKPIEVEFFETRKVNRKELAYLFNEQTIIAEELKKEAASKECNLWSWAFHAAGVLSLLLLMGSCISNGKEIANYKFDVTRLTEGGTIQGPFQLNKMGHIYSLVLSSSLPDNSNAWAATELLDVEKMPINTVEGDFFKESGYDSDGSWSESNLSSNKTFRLDNPGSYYVRILGEKGTAKSGKLTLQIFQDVPISRYYLMAMLMSFGFGFAIRRYKTLNPLYVVIGILALGFFILSSIEWDGD